tara:strand:- start:66 stop:203 length:138 start_codon:yes stop_codon:yes gene_type:complete
LIEKQLSKQKKLQEKLKKEKHKKLDLETLVGQVVQGKNIDKDIQF